MWWKEKEREKSSLMARACARCLVGSLVSKGGRRCLGGSWGEPRSLAALAPAGGAAQSPSSLCSRPARLPEGEQTSQGHNQLAAGELQLPGSRLCPRTAKVMSRVCPQHPYGAGCPALPSSEPLQEVADSPLPGHSLGEGWETKGKMVQNRGPVKFHRSWR